MIDGPCIYQYISAVGERDFIYNRRGETRGVDIPGLFARCERKRKSAPADSMYTTSSNETLENAAMPARRSRLAATASSLSEATLSTVNYRRNRPPRRGALIFPPAPTPSVFSLSPRPAEPVESPFVADNPYIVFRAAAGV